MAYLRHRGSGAVTEDLDTGSQEYQLLSQQNLATAITSFVPTGMSGLPAGETGATIPAGQPVWEEIAQEDAGFPDPAGGRVLVVACPGTTTANGTETTRIPPSEEVVAGTLTDVEYVPNSAIPGVATNNRIVTLQQVQVAGTTTPARTVTALAAVTFDATHSNPGGQVATPLTITSASFSAADPVQLEVASTVNGTGQVDPGGVLYAVYTRA